MKRASLKILIAMVMAYPSIAFTREPYHAEIAVSGTEVNVSAPNLLNLKRSLSTESLQELAPIYTPTSQVTLGINLRGLEAITSFAANSTVLNVVIPNAGITTSFDGGSRDQSLSLFREFIRDASGGGRLLRSYARYSPIDPIAGNPTSLMGQMGQADYLLGKLTPLQGCSFTSQPIVHLFQGGFRAGRAFLGGYDATVVSAPLRYSYSPNGESAFIIDAPITYLRNGGASSLVGSIGFGFRWPVNQAWSLTPTARMGFGGSLDLCVSGTFVSPGILSVYNLAALNGVLSLSNYGAYYASTNLWLTGVNYNYRLYNFVTKNGLSFTTCEAYSFCNRTLNFSLNFVDTFFPGHKLYIKHYDEIGASILVSGLNRCLNYDCLILGFNYQFGEKHFKSYMFNLDYQF